MPSLFDMGAGVLAVIMGPGVFVIWGIPAVLVETLILRFALPKAKALRDSIVVNLASAVVGLALAIPANYLYYWAGNILELDSWDLYEGTSSLFRLYFLAIFVAFLIMTVVIEGAILKFYLEPWAPGSRVLATVIGMNLVSYAVPLIVLFLLFDL